MGMGSKPMSLRTLSVLLAGATLMGGLPAHAQTYPGRDGGGGANASGQGAGQGDGEEAVGERRGGRRLAVEP